MGGFRGMENWKEDEEAEEKFSLPINNALNTLNSSISASFAWSISVSFCPAMRTVTNINKLVTIMTLTTFGSSKLLVPINKGCSATVTYPVALTIYEHLF
jgi:hypothetical protein